MNIFIQDIVWDIGPEDTTHFPTASGELPKNVFLTGSMDGFKDDEDLFDFLAHYYVWEATEAGKITRFDGEANQPEMRHADVIVLDKPYYGMPTQQFVVFGDGETWADLAGSKVVEVFDPLPDDFNVRGVVAAIEAGTLTGTITDLRTLVE